MAIVPALDLAEGHKEKAAGPEVFEHEAGILGMLLYDNAAFSNLPYGFGPEHFADPVHRKIFAVTQQRLAAGDRADPVTVGAVLQTDPGLRGYGGQDYLLDLYDRAPPSSTIGSYAKIALDSYSRRVAMDVARDLFTAAQETQQPFTAALSEAERELATLHMGGKVERFQDADSVLDEVLDYIDNPGAHAAGVQTGLEPLDSLLGPMLPGDLIFIGARPSMGKSAVAAVIAQNIAQAGFGVAEIHGEMTPQQAWRRRLTATAYAIGAERAPAYSAIRKRQIDYNERELLQAARERLRGIPLVALKRAGITLGRLRALALQQRDAFERQGRQMGALFIDHVGLIRPDRHMNSRVDQQTEISFGLKVLADDLQIPIIALAQLSRANEAREDKRPQLSDLRDSGCLAGDTLIWVPDYGAHIPISVLASQFVPPRVAALAGDGSITRAYASRAWKTGSDHVYELKTGSGLSIKATANHKFLTESGWKRLDELLPADRVCVPTVLPAAKMPATLTKAQARFIGHMMARGCTLPKHAVQFTSAQDWAIEEMLQLTAEVFGGEVVCRVHEAADHKVLFMKGIKPPARGTLNPVGAWFRLLGLWDKRAHERAVPEIMFQQPPEVVAEFLGALWADDGTLFLQERQDRPSFSRAITYNTSSETQAMGIHDCLLLLGIKSHVRRYAQKKGRDQYFVSIARSCGMRSFVDQVRLDGGKKTETARALRATLSEGLGYDGERYWDSISSISYVGAEEVFDISVPVFHSFIANSMIVHNSLEQDSDVVIGLYREAYYASREREPDLDAKGGVPWAEWDARRRSPWIEALFLKTREGETGTAKLWAHMPTNTILGAAPDDHHGGLL